MVGGDVAIQPGSLAVWFLYKGRCWDIARVYDAAGSFRGYYVDAVEPLYWKDQDGDTLLPIVDLFLDLWLWPEGGATILDEDELEAATVAQTISASQIELAKHTVATLVRDAKAGRFPPTEVRRYRLADEDVLSLMNAVSTAPPGETKS